MVAPNPYQINIPSALTKGAQVVNKQQSLNLQQQVAEEIDPEPAYLAKGEDKWGRPYYGPGIQGYAKKIFANIFNPRFYVPKPSKQQAELIERGADVGGEMLNDRVGWDKWIGKWTGISAEEVGRAATAIRMTGAETDESGNLVEQSGADKAKGFIQAGAKFFYQAGKQGISTGLDALGLVDQASRKFQATQLAIDDIGDSSSVLPDVTFFDDSTKFGAIANALVRLAPPVMAYNSLRAITNGKSIASNDKTIKNYQRGSDMLYTMYWEEAKKKEYLRRLQAGENPDLLEAELQNVWVELAGSIIGDPTTYLGMGIPGKFGKASTAVKIPFTQKVLFNVPWTTTGRIPGLTEMFHLKGLGRARLASAGDFFTNPATKELDNTLKMLEKSPSDSGALKVLKAAVEQTGETVKKFSKSYGFFSPDSAAKTDVVKKTVGTVYRTIASTFRDGDDVGEFVKAAKMITASDPQKQAEAFSVLSRYGNLPFSEGGMRAINYLAKLDDEVKIFNLIEKHVDDLPELTKVVEEKLFKIVEDTFPSVDDMAKAAEEVKTIGKNLDNLDPVAKADITKKIELAKEYNRLPKFVKWSNSVNSSWFGTNGKPFRAFQSFFAGVYMGISPAYAMRNLQSNVFHIWHDLGSKAAGEAIAGGLAAAVPLKGKDIATTIEAAEAAKTAKLLGGALPTQFTKAIGQAGVDNAFGALGVGQRIEQVHSAIIVRNVVETEIEKMLRYGFIPEVPNLPAEQASRLKQLALENYGDVKATLAAFRKEVKQGEFEVFRSLELDPNFKDWLRKANQLDELEDIRKTSQTAEEFVSRMEEMVKKLDDLAKRAADDPVLVSDTNAMGEAAVVIERAFAGNKKILSQAEISQFKALTELWDQTRLAYSNIASSLKMQLSRMLPASEVKRFDDGFNVMNTEFNAVVGQARDLATNFYEGAYKQSKQGVPPAELWNKMTSVVLNSDGQMVRVSMAKDFPNVDPSMITNSEFEAMAWKWVKENQSRFWRDYNQAFIMKQDELLEEMAKVSGTTLDQVKTQLFQGADNPKLKHLDDLMKQIKEWDEYIDFQSFELAATPRADEINKVVDTAEEGMRAADNVNAPPPVDESITITPDVEGNPIQLLAKKGGVNIDEFSDVMGGKVGVDRLGSTPGLFAKGGMGLDDAGRLLAENGFITAEQADDLNFVRDFIRKPRNVKPVTLTKRGAKLSDLDLHNVPNWKGGKSRLFNAVNKDRVARGLEPYSTIDNVPFDEAVDALKQRTKPIPPRVETTTPTIARQLYENMNGGAKDALQQFTTETVKNWGKTMPVTDLGDEAELGISTWAKEMDKRMITVRAKAMATADATRNFILHDYNKTYADKFFGSFLQYHYWTSRTYMRWMERALDTPGTLSAYAKLKSALDKEHSDMPEFYRYQVPIGKLLGMNDSEMYINLEASLNPLYGLTGTDFNDPNRRADWISTSIDDMNKFGFNLFTPLNWLVAGNLYNKGEDEAAERWMGRLIPGTQALKAGLNVLEDKSGIDLMPNISALPGTKYGEFDPFVNVFGDGTDPYEDKRISRAMANIIRANPQLKEQAFDELYKKDGQLYDQAVEAAISERSGGQLASFFLGTGYKTRTEGDMMVDKFYTKYYKLLSVRDNISPEDYRSAFDQLKEEFPFADALLLSKRGGDERDGAYAYNILSRVPPGQYITDRELLDKFYEDKGNFENWSEQDKNRFMADILDAAVLLKMPDQATKEDWNEARDINKGIYDQIKQEFNNPEIWDVVNTYYELKDSNPAQANIFKEDHPEIAAALTRRQELLMQNPAAFAYFGSIDSVENYFDGKVRAQLKEQFGDLAPLWKQYYDLQIQGKKAEAKAFYRAHPELKEYSAMKKQLTEEATQQFVHTASLLPEREYLELRDDIGELTSAQQDLMNRLQPQQQPSWGEIVQVTGADMSPAMQTILQTYWQTGDRSVISSAAQKQLDYLASRYGAQLGVNDAESFLRLTGLAMQQPQVQQPPPSLFTQPPIP